MKQLSTHEIGFKSQKAQFKVRAEKDVMYGKFSTECSGIVTSLGEFLETCEVKTARALATTASDDVTQLLNEVVALKDTAEHHLVGAVAAKKTFCCNSFLGR